MRPPLTLNGGRLAARPFGRTGLALAPVMLGAAPLGHMPETFAYAPSEAEALATIRATLTGPFNGIDTAASYGDGESERRVGLVIRELGGMPDGYLVATKADRDLTTDDFSGSQMRRSVERSMALLGLDHLPLVYLHDPEREAFETLTAPGGAVEVLLDLQREGLIGALGVAGGPIPEMIRYVETGVFSAIITHNRFTLLNRSADPLLDVAQERGIAVCNAAPYGSGILAKGPEAYPRYAYQDAPAEMVRRVGVLRRTCDEFGVPLAAAALQFSVRDPRIDVTIVGMTKPDRVTQTVELATLPIPDALWPALAAIPPDSSDPEASRWE
ncbi:MAG: aldo/keto reductase [Chloroflexota bacterium]|nr:aldo/keto reductase [Chloroflexota bacterium]